MLARIRDTEIFFDIDGSGLKADGARMVEKPPVFLLPGGPGGDHVGYRNRISELTDVAQLVYVDHRGAGRSARHPASAYTMDNNIDDLDALRAYLGFERICVMGGSYGGMVAQGYALRYPERVSNLILISTSHSYRFLAEAQKFIAERGTADQKRVCQTLWDAKFTSDEELKEYYRIMSPLYSLKFDPAKFDDSWGRSIRNYEMLNAGFGGFIRTFDFLDDLHRITCPTLVLGGRHDWICPVGHSVEIAERIPRAQLKIFENSSHSIASDEPDAFLAAVRGFLTYAPK